jgi:DNA end-binding protein Ku
MAYTLRYEEELRKGEDYFSDLKHQRNIEIDKKQLAMAVQLIEAYLRPFNLDDFKDDYEAALRKLIKAKQKDTPLPLEEETLKPTKVINLMDALRRSVGQIKKPPARARGEAKAAEKKGPVLVSGSRRKHKVA